MQKFAKVLFWLGIVVAVVQLVSGVSNIIQMYVHVYRGSNGLNFAAPPAPIRFVTVMQWVSTLIMPFWEGGLMIGVAKILEKLYAPKRDGAR